MQTSLEEIREVLGRLGVDLSVLDGGPLSVRSPVDGQIMGNVAEQSPDDVSDIIGTAQAAFQEWREYPAPRRGELIRLLAEELRASKADLGRVVTLEAGKIISEGLGEVQEMIDICDFAVGLSRQLYGLTIATERTGHRMMETWHPLGVVGVITAFNFPVAVWCWNTALALTTGNSVVWKPSEKSPLTALACQAIFQRAVMRFGGAPDGLLGLVIGGQAAGQALVDDSRIPLVSATGSTRMGREIAPRLSQRFARSILELGGNNGAIVTPTADLALVLRGVAFAAMGTCGQRCTTLRRLFVHDSIYETFVDKLKIAYQSVAVGDPRHEETLIGPLIDEVAFAAMQAALDEARAMGADVQGGEAVFVNDGGYYVQPAIVEIDHQAEVVKRETFAPILYIMRYFDFDEAIALHNAVPQGLSSSVFTNDMREAERFMSSSGSDCGICNVNIGPSGSEIGGAFGGEKETGGGRESGSDAWKGYMRRATNTINYSRELPLAQGVRFDVE